MLIINILSNAERLEKCKTFANADDIDWLTRRVEELGIGVKYLQDTNECLQRNIHTLRETRLGVASLHQSILNRKEKENARLRKALTIIRDNVRWGDSYNAMENAYQTAKSALEETK